MDSKTMMLMMNMMKNGDNDMSSMMPFLMGDGDIDPAMMMMLMNKNKKK